MGQFRFHVPDARAFDPLFWSTAYVTGIEGIPWPGRVTYGDDWVLIDRKLEESGKISLVWPTQEFGPIVLKTASLRCQKDPYDLAMELARGTIHRVRGRGLDWQRLGLRLPDPFCQLAENSLQFFLDAILAETDPPKRNRLCQQAIESSMAASRPLAKSFVEQSLIARHQQEEKFGTLFGTKLETNEQWRTHADVFRPAMNLAGIGLEWGKIEADSGRTDYEVFDQQIEWARANGLRVCGGPLISLQPQAMPQWLYLLDDFDLLLQSACEFARKTVLRYKGQVHLWSAAAGMNCPNDLGLTDEQVLRLAVGVIQTVRRTDERTPVILHLDMPWAEYLGQKEQAISPIHFADALIRADLGLSGIGLEFNMNYWPGGTLPRDLIEISDLIDQWAMLGMPLMATVNAPFDCEHDPKASGRTSIVSRWSNPILKPMVPSGHPPMPPSGIEVIEMLMAKTNVHGIVWGQSNDALPHHFPNAGLYDSHGQMRPTIANLTELRRLHIQ